MEPEDLAQLQERNPEKSSSPSSLEQGLTISETILLKYKRSNELRTFFEKCYQTQNQNVKELHKRIDVLEHDVATKESTIAELTDEVSRL